MRTKQTRALLFCIVWMLFLLPVLLFGQEENTRHILERVDYRADKRTRPNAMERALDITAGMEFRSEEALAAFLETKAQELRNLRVFNNVLVTYEVLHATENTISYAALFEVEDSWTFYPIPTPKYDSNYGVSVGLALDFRNFFGSLIRFKISDKVNFRLTETTEDKKIRVPYWMVNPQFSGIQIGRQNLSFGASQEFDGRGGGDSALGNEFGKRYVTSIEGKTAIAMAQNLYLNVAPSIHLYYAYRDAAGMPIATGGQNRFSAGLTYGIAYNDVDWIDNMRKGLQLELVKNWSYGIDLSGVPSMAGNLTFIAAWYQPVLILNPSFRFMYHLNYTSEWNGFGQYLRGIRNQALSGWTGATLNMSLGIRAIRLPGYGELQVQPFFDIGFAVPKEEDFNLSDNLKYAAGLDMILYIDKLKGLTACLTFGIDFTHPRWDEFEKYEIIIGTTLSY